MALREFDSVKVGDQLPEKVIPLTRQDLVNYAGVSGDLNPIHWDDEIAKQVGLDVLRIAPRKRRRWRGFLQGRSRPTPYRKLRAKQPLQAGEAPHGNVTLLCTIPGFAPATSTPWTAAGPSA